MGRPFLELCDDDEQPRYTCGGCGADIATSNQLIWSGSMGNDRPAFLLRDTTSNVTVTSSVREERLSTGMYSLCDVGCRGCQQPLGWRYVHCAAGPDQQYKQGCSLLEQASLRLHPSRNSLRAARDHIQAVAAGGTASSSLNVARSSPTVPESQGPGQPAHLSRGPETNPSSSSQGTQQQQHAPRGSSAPAGVQDRESQHDGLGSVAEGPGVVEHAGVYAERGGGMPGAGMGDTTGSLPRHDGPGGPMDRVEWLAGPSHVQSTMQAGQFWHLQQQLEQHLQQQLDRQHLRPQLYQPQAWYPNTQDHPGGEQQVAASHLAGWRQEPASWLASQHQWLQRQQEYSWLASAGRPEALPPALQGSMPALQGSPGQERNRRRGGSHQPPTDRNVSRGSGGISSLLPLPLPSYAAQHHSSSTRSALQPYSWDTRRAPGGTSGLANAYTRALLAMGHDSSPSAMQLEQGHTGSSSLSELVRAITDPVGHQDSGSDNSALQNVANAWATVGAGSSGWTGGFTSWGPSSTSHAPGWGLSGGSRISPGWDLPTTHIPFDAPASVAPTARQQPSFIVDHAGMVGAGVRAQALARDGAQQQPQPQASPVAPVSGSAPQGQDYQDVRLFPAPPSAEPWSYSLMFPFPSAGTPQASRPVPSELFDSGTSTGPGASLLHNRNLGSGAAGAPMTSVSFGFSDLGLASPNSNPGGDIPSHMLPLPSWSHLHDDQPILDSHLSFPVTFASGPVLPAAREEVPDNGAPPAAGSIPPLVLPLPAAGPLPTAPNPPQPQDVPSLMMDARRVVQPLGLQGVERPDVSTAAASGGPPHATTVRAARAPGWSINSSTLLLPPHLLAEAQAARSRAAARQRLQQQAQQPSSDQQQQQQLAPQQQPGEEEQPAAPEAPGTPTRAMTSDSATLVNSEQAAGAGQ